MRTSLIFASSLAISVGTLFAVYVLIGYADNAGYPTALGSAFRKSLEIAMSLSVLNWMTNRVKDLKRKLGKTVKAVGGTLT